MRVFVTGGTGLLGGHIVKELLNRAHEVRALVRCRERASCLDVKVERVLGDLRDINGFESHLAGVDALIHAGACYGEYYRSNQPSLLNETNVDGTARLLEASLQRGIKNMVYISSSAVLSSPCEGTVDETRPYNEDTVDPYFRSKIEAEKAVRGFLDAHPSVRGVILLPSVMLGPGDRGPTPTGAFISKLLRGEMKFVLPGWNRIVDARDVAWSAVEALQKGRSGERYLIGGCRCSLAEIYRTLSEVSGRPMPTKQISVGKLLFVTQLMSLVSVITRRPPPLKPHIVKRLQESFGYCSAKAERELGIRFRPFSQTLADTSEWFSAGTVEPI